MTRNEYMNRLQHILKRTDNTRELLGLSDVGATEILSAILAVNADLAALITLLWDKD